MRLAVVHMVAFALSLTWAGGVAAQNADAEEVSSWRIDDGRIFAVGLSVVDTRRRSVYTIDTTPPAARRGTSPTQTPHRIIALRAGNGQARWRSVLASVPLFVTGRYLLALREPGGGRGPAILLLSTWNGEGEIECGGDVPELPNASNADASLRVRARVVGDRTFIVASDVDGGPGEQVFEVRLSGPRCTVGRIDALPAPAPTFTLVRRGPEGSAGYAVMRAEESGPVEAFVASRGAAVVTPSVDGRHLRVIEDVQTPAGRRHRITFFDVAAGERVARFDTERDFSGEFVVMGRRVILVTPAAVASLDLEDGRHRWTHALPDLRFHRAR